jgi:hypothetical protein
MTQTYPQHTNIVYSAYPRDFEGEAYCYNLTMEEVISPKRSVLSTKLQTAIPEQTISPSLPLSIINMKAKQISPVTCTQQHTSRNVACMQFNVRQKVLSLPVNQPVAVTATG